MNKNLNPQETASQPSEPPGLRLQGAQGFFASLARYYCSFLDTDFKKDRLPKRRLENKDRKGRVVGIPLQKYPGLQQKVWEALDKPVKSGLTYRISRGTYRSTIPQPIRDTINRQVNAIAVEDLHGQLAEILDALEAQARAKKQDPELFREGFIEELRRALAQKTVGPLLDRMETFFARTENRPIESMLDFEDQLCALLASGIEDHCGEALSALLVDFDQTPLAELLRDQFDREVLKRKLRSFFETFTSGDIFADLSDIEMSARLLENSELYLHIGEVHYRNHAFPLFYIPLTLEREDGTFTLQSEPHLYVNKKALDYLTQQVALAQSTVTPSIVKNRLFYLEAEDLPSSFIQPLVDAFCSACHVRAEIDFCTPRYQIAQSADLKLNNRVSLSLFDKSDESMVNDYEALLTGLEGAGPLVGVFQDLVRRFLLTNPVDATLKVDGQWDKTPMADRLVFDSPLPLVEEQRKILAALNRQEVQFLCVEGPPGTGKSHTIAAIAFETILSGKSLLVLSDKKEALDVVEDKLNTVLSKVRMGDDFQNPILRLGKTSSNYNQVLRNETIERIKTQLKIAAAQKKEIAIQHGRETEKVKHALKKTAEAYQRIRPQAMATVLEEEEALRRKLPALEDPGAAQLLDDILALRSSLRPLGPILRPWLAHSKGRIAGALKLAQRMARALKPLELGPEALDPFDPFGSPQIKDLQAIITDIETARMPVFGYLFAGGRLRSVRARLQSEFQIELPSPHKSLGTLKEVLSTARKVQRALQEAGLEAELLVLALDLLRRDGVERVAGLEKEQALGTRVEHDLGRRENPFPEIAQDLAGALFDDDHRLTAILEEAQDHHRRKTEILETFSSVPDLDYLASKTRIESLNSQRLAQVIDERVVDFFYNHKADAKTLAKIIRAKSKFPTEKFAQLRGAFPCIIAGLRDYAEFIPLELGMFDLVVIDEASQVSIAQAMPAILRAKKMVVFGDRKQFGNVKTTQASREINNAYMNELMESFRQEFGGRDLSALERAKIFDIRSSLMDFFEMTSNFSIQLRKHFRGYPEMIGFSSQNFYNGQLQAMKIRGKPIEDVIRFDPIEHDGLADPTRNTNQIEAEHILREIEALLEDKDPPSVGVITPHTEQQSLISKMVHDHPRSREMFSTLHLKIMTFDTCQGEERDLIFYSLVATRDKDRLSHIFPSSLKGDDDVIDHNLRMQRLNVGLSRGKEQLVFVHSKPIEDYRSAIREALLHFRRALEQAKALPSQEEVDPRSPAEAKVLHWLSQTKLVQSLGESIEVLPQFELGKYLKSLDPTYDHPEYRVDFLLRIKDGTRVHHIILEYDGFEYHFVKSGDVHAGNWDHYLSERDIEREKVLESFGYKMLRINRFNVGKDPVATLDTRIGELLQSLLNGRKPHELVSRLATESEKAHLGMQKGTHKHCKKCDQIKPKSDFRDTNTQSGFGRYCRACKSKKTTRRYYW